MKAYFSNVQTLDELRKQYKNLLKKYHPDNENGSEEATKIINAEYENLFRILKDRHTRLESDSTDTGADGNTGSSKASYGNMNYDFSEDSLLRKMLQKVVHFSDITIEIIGNWLWIGDNTYPHRKDFKDLGFKFAGRKKCWFWHSENYRKRSHKVLSMEDIRNFYGSTHVEPDKRKRLEA